MSEHSVSCIAFSRLQADQMIQRLRAAAFPVPDISVLYASGPMIAALGDMIQGFMNKGIPLHKARLYEICVKEGHTLVSVLTDSESKMALAREILSKTGGNDICYTGDFTMPHYTSPTSHLVQMSNDQFDVV